MSQNRVINERIKAKGDGNCALNAFALGLADEKILNALTQNQADILYRDFLVAAAAELQIEPTWQSIKNYLLQADPIQLQIKLAPILRALAINRIEDKNTPYGKTHMSQTLNALRAEFKEYAMKQAGMHLDEAFSGGDIFQRHAFILKQFADLYKDMPKNSLAFETALDAQLLKLNQWWRSPQGHASFLLEMRKNAKFAGDLELAPLAEYFGINIDVKRGGFTLRMHHANGNIAEEVLENELGLTEVEQKELTSRGIMDMLGNLLPLTENAVIQRLIAIPHVEEIVAYIKAGHAKKDTRIPRLWLNEPECLNQLLERGLAKMNEQGEALFAYDLHPINSVIRVLELNKEKTAAILAARNKTYRSAPVMTLENQNAVHWDCIKPKRVVSSKPLQVNKPNVASYSELKEQVLTQHFPKFDATKWEELKTRAKQQNQKLQDKQKAGQSVNCLTYTLFDGGTVQVTRKMQVKLDAELAKKYQDEEYQVYHQAKKPT